MGNAVLSMAGLWQPLSCKRQPQGVGIQLAVDQQQVRHDVAFAVERPIARKIVIAFERGGSVNRPHENPPSARANTTQQATKPIATTPPKHRGNSAPSSSAAAGLSACHAVMNGKAAWHGFPHPKQHHPLAPEPRVMRSLRLLLAHQDTCHRAQAALHGGLELWPLPGKHPSGYAAPSLTGTHQPHRIFSSANIDINQSVTKSHEPSVIGNSSVGSRSPIPV